MQLIAVTNDQLVTSELIETLIAIEPYIDGVILREKSKSDAEVLSLVQGLIKAQFDPEKIIVHSKAQLAFAENIKRVQLPGRSTPLSILKKKYTKIYFGKSVHSLGEAEAAEKKGASSVLYGHLFATNSKAGLPSRGLDELKQIVSALDIPVYAIGGIKPGHVEQLKSIGIAGIAVHSSIFESEIPEKVAMAYYDAIKRGAVGDE